MPPTRCHGKQVSNEINIHKHSKWVTIGCVSLCSLVLVVVAFRFCQLVSQGQPIYGDPAQGFEYNNYLDDVVKVSYGMDVKGHEQEWWGGVTVQPGSQRVEYVMLEGQGVEIRVTTMSGNVVYDRYYRWEDFPKGEKFVITIE